MKQRSLLVILAVFIVTVALLAVNGGTAQAAGLAQPQSQTACSPSITVMNANDSGAGSLRQAIDDLCTGGTITFNGDYTIILASTLSINKNITIDGVGRSITLDGNNTVLVIVVAMNGTLNLQNLTVWRGSNSLGGGGGGIKTSGDLNVTNVYFANNTTTGSGGGIYVTPVFSPPIITVTNSTFYQNSASEGGAISNYGSIATVTGSTFWGNSASNKGGAIEQDGWGSTVVTNSTFFLNTAAGTYGGGAIDSDDSDLSVVNSTFSGNTNSYAAIVVLYGDLTFHNNIVRRSSPQNCDLVPDTSSISNNLADDNSCGSGFTNSPNILLGPRGTYGGNTETFPLLPGSAAIDGTSTNCPATDQRGVARGSTCDIGAFESRGFTLNISGGNNQTTFINTPFANPLQLSVGSAYGEPVNGGVVTFARPGSGPSINPSSNVTATVSGDNISRNVSANGIAGSYSVTATANGASNQYFSLTNIAGTTTSLASSLNPSGYGQGVIFTATVTSGGGIPTGSVQFYADGLPLGSPVTLAGGIATATTSALSVGSHPITATYSGSANYTASTSAFFTQIVTCFNALTVTTAADSGPGSLRYAVAAVCPGGSITFAGDYTINLASELPIAKSLTIDATGHTVTVSGNNAVRVFDITGGGNTVILKGMTIANGRSDQGGGIYTTAQTTADRCTFTGNRSSSSGGAIAVWGGSLTITNSTFSENASEESSAGAIFLGSGSLTATNCTFSENSSISSGGALYNQNGWMTLNNVTLSNNTAAYGTGGGIFLSSAAFPSRMTSSLVAGSGANGNCGGEPFASGSANNLADDGSCSGGFSQVTSVGLAPLGDYGGDTQTMRLKSDSPAIDAGAGCPTADQRDQTRDDLACDIGAYELKYADSPTVIRSVSTVTSTTFGPALMGIQRDAGFSNPGVITVTKSAWRTQGPESIGATWAITPTTTSGFSLTLQLCYTPAELGSLTESALRFWRNSGSTWAENTTVPVLSTVNGNRCAAVSGIQALSTWTLATATPTAVTIEHLAATSNPIGVWGPIGLVTLLVLIVGFVVLHRRQKTCA